MKFKQDLITFFTAIVVAFSSSALVAESIDSSTVLLLHFDSNSQDSSINQNNAFCSGSYQAGKFGQAVDEPCSIPNDGDYDFGSGDFTIELWFNKPTYSGQSLIDFRPDFVNIPGPSIGVNHQVNLHWYGQDVLGGGIVSLNTWHHVAYSRENGIARLFFDGVQVGNDWADNHVYDLPSSLRLGSNAHGNPDFDGIVDEVRISNIARYTTDFIPQSNAFSEPQSYEYYILNPNMTNDSAYVVSLADNNVITAGLTVLQLDKNELGVIPQTDLAQGTKISSMKPFSMGSNVNATDMPVHISMAGQLFAIPHIRSSHRYFILSTDGDANISIDSGAGVNNFTALQGQVLTVDAGNTNNIAAIISSDLPVLVMHGGHTGSSVNRDVYAVPPVSLDVWGVKRNTYVAAVQDNTSVTVYASNGQTQSLSLNAGSIVSISIGDNSAQSSGSALHIVSDKPISAIEYADSDGLESTAFYDVSLLGSHYGIPVDTQYVAVACPDSGTIVTLFDSVNSPETLQCDGDGITPGKAYFGSTSNGKYINAGSYIESNLPIFLIYETSSANDEHNLIGVFD